MTAPAFSDSSFQPDQTPDYADAASTYTDLINTIDRSGVSAAYHDVSKHTINILELPDMRLLDAPSHTAIFGRTGSGKSVLVAPKLLEELSRTHSHLKINFRPNPAQ